MNVEFVTHSFVGLASCLIYSSCFLQARAPLLPCSHCLCTLICRAVCCSLLHSVCLFAVCCCVLQCVAVCTFICRPRASFISDKSHSYAGWVSHLLQLQTYLTFLASISNVNTFFLEFHDLFICGVRGFYLYMRFVTHSSTYLVLLASRSDMMPSFAIFVIYVWSSCPLIICEVCDPFINVHGASCRHEQYGTFFPDFCDSFMKYVTIVHV